MNAKYSVSGHTRPLRVGPRFVNSWEFFRNGVAVGRIIETEHGYRGEFSTPRTGTVPIREQKFRQSVIDRMTKYADQVNWN